MKRTLVVILHAALSFGCDPEDIEHDGDSGDDAEQTFPSRFAEAYCAALFACDPVTTCTDSETPYASEAECIDGERTALEQASAVARDAGMTYDDACVDSWIAQYEEVGCDGSTRIIQRFGEQYRPIGCQPYFGSIPEGEDPCFDVVGSELDSCGQGLECVDETCQVLESSRCECPEGTVCEYAIESAECLPILAVGDVCMLQDSSRPGVCPIDAYCDFQFDDEGTLLFATCVESVPMGASCDASSDCESYACEDGMCIPASPVLCGEPFAPRRFR